jgi:hypothetical protein
MPFKKFSAQLVAHVVVMFGEAEFDSRLNFWPLEKLDDKHAELLLQL